MSFRKEKKYKLTLSDQKILKKTLFNKGMKTLYPERKVNSVYFDTTNLDFFLNSEKECFQEKNTR